MSIIKYQNGKQIAGPTVYSKYDPAYKAYQDSLWLYNSMNNEMVKWNKSFFQSQSKNAYNKWKVVSTPPAIDKDLRYLANYSTDEDNNKSHHDDTKENYEKYKYIKPIATVGPMFDIRDKGNPNSIYGTKPEYTEGHQMYAVYGIYKKPTAPPILANVPKLQPRYNSTKLKLQPRVAPQFPIPPDRTLSNTQGVYLNTNRYMVPGAKIGQQKIDFYDNGDTEWSNKQKMDIITYKKGGIIKCQRGNVAPYITTNPNDPRIQAYQDSLNAYNAGENSYKFGKSIYDNVRSSINVKFRKDYDIVPHNDELKRAKPFLNTGILPISAYSEHYVPKSRSWSDKLFGDTPDNFYKDSEGNHWEPMGTLWSRFKKPTQTVILKSQPQKTVKKFLNVKTQINNPKSKIQLMSAHNLNYTSSNNNLLQKRTASKLAMPMDKKLIKENVSWLGGNAVGRDEKIGNYKILTYDDGSTAKVKTNDNLQKYPDTRDFKNYNPDTKMFMVKNKLGGLINYKN